MVSLKTVGKKPVVAVDGLLKHGGMLFVATLAAAFLGYLYHLLMGRMLGAADYGALASLFAFIYIFATPTGLSGAMQLSAAREISQLKAAGKRKELLQYLGFFSRQVLLIATAVFFVFLLLSPFVASFLHIELLSVVALAVLLFIYLVLVVPWGALQGLQLFAQYSISNFLMALFKLAFGLLLVFFGLSVAGAVTGVTIGLIAALLFSMFFLKDFFKAKTKPTGKKFVFFSWSVLLSLFFLMFLINIDILLVKHFFSAVQAGQYSIASLLGKLIYFLAISLATVMLPMVSESMNRKKGIGLLKKSFLYTACFSVFLVFGFWFFSKQIVAVFFGAAFAPSAELLPLFGIAMVFFSFSNILVYFEMALKRARQVFLLAFFAVAEALGVLFFHSSLEQVLLVVVSVNVLLFVALLLNVLFLERE